MDKAIVGYMRVGHFRVGVFHDDWDRLVKQFENLCSADVTHRRLQLDSPRDSTTGWWTKSFHEETVEMPIIQKGTAHSLLPPGTYVRTDALGLTADPVVEGDEILANDTYYEVEGVRSHYFLDNFSYRECDLTLLPLKHLTGGTYTDSTVEDARYRNKVYLETWLNVAALPNYIVAYGFPDYPLVRVFKDKGVDLVFSIGEPESEPLLGHDKYAYGYKERVPITTFCIDKTGISGTKLKWRAEAELRRITETYPLGSLRTLEKIRDNDQNLGSTILYSREFTLNYQRNKT